MATTIINVTGASRGVAEDETGINIARISTRFFPEFKDKLPGKTGETRGFAVPAILSREISVTGEVTGSTGIMVAAHAPANLAAAVVIANSLEGFGVTDANGGTIFMDEATLSEERGGWKSLDIKLSADPGIILT